MLPVLRGQATDRKYRLFAIACCRQIKPLFTDERTRRALEVCERFVEGLADLETLQKAFDGALAVYDENPDDSQGVESSALAMASTCWTNDEKRETSLIDVVDNTIGVACFFFPWKNAKQIQRRRVCRLLREIFGNPFCPVSLSAGLLAWKEATVPRMAQAIYNEHAFELLPILGDAMEEAGCTDELILGHCRGPGEHFRGCWLVDAILGNN